MKWLLLLILLTTLASPATAQYCQYVTMGFYGGDSITLTTPIWGDTVTYTPSGTIGCDEIYNTEYVSKVEYYFDGKLIGSGQGGSVSWYNTYYFSFPTVTLKLGTHGFTVVAYLNQGIFMKSQIVNVVPGTGNPISGEIRVAGLLGSERVAYARIDYPLEGQRIKTYLNEPLNITGYGWDAGTAIGYVIVKLDGSDLGSVYLSSSGVNFTIPLPSSISEGKHRIDVYLTYGSNTKYIGAVNFSVVREPDLSGTVFVNSSDPIVGAPGNWCRGIAKNTYLCGDSDPVAIRTTDFSVIRRNDPAVMPPNSSMVNFDPVRFIPPPFVDIYTVDIGNSSKIMKRFIVGNNSTVDLSFNTTYCEYKATFYADSYVDTCCMIYDKVYPVQLLARNPEIINCRYQNYITDACYYWSASKYPFISTVNSTPVRVLFAVSHPSNPGAYTGVIATVSGIAYPPVIYSTPSLNFKLPSGELPLNQMIMPVGVQRDYNNTPHTTNNQGGWACLPTNIKINSIPVTLSLIKGDWSKTFLINPVVNRPGVAEERDYLVEYLTVDTQRTYYSYYAKVPAKRGEAYLEGSTFDMVFTVDTTSPLVNATFWNASNPGLKISCNRNASVDTIVRKDSMGNNVTISCQITDPMKNITVKNWVALNTSELWYLEACNEEGLCNSTYVNILGAKMLDVQVSSMPTPVPGNLSLQIIYPTYGATVPPGTLTAKATASVSGGYGRVERVDFTFSKWSSDPSLTGWVSQCSVTRTAPDSGSTYSAPCDVTEGRWKLTVFARDSNGNLLGDTVEFNVNSGGSGGGGGGGGEGGAQGPSITGFSYPVQCVVDGSNVTVTFSASSPNGLSRAALYADGVLAAETGLSGSNANNVQMTFRVNFNGKQYMMLKLVVTDGKGLSAEATGMIVPCNVCPDQTPTVNLIKPTEDRYTISEGSDTVEIPVTVSFSDDTLIKRLELYINGVSYFGIDLSTTSGSLVISPDITSLRLTEGNYTIKAVVWDSCNQTAVATKDIHVERETQKIPLVCTYTNDSTGFSGPVNYKLNTTYYSIGQLKFVAEGGPYYYYGVPEFYTDLKQTTNLGSSKPRGDDMNMGWYDPSRNLVHIENPCAPDMATAMHVYYTFYDGIDYNYEFQSGCCRSECRPGLLGIPICVQVC
jgi:hypothetical protein